MRQTVKLRPLAVSDHPALIKLWSTCAEIDIRPTDTPEALHRFLTRNAGCSFGACAGTRLIGAVLAGQDGWRGYLYHMAVKPDFRERGTGAELVKAAVTALRETGAPKVHCLVKRDNLIAQQFWEACGFSLRDELYDYTLS